MPTDAILRALEPVAEACGERVDVAAGPPPGAGDVPEGALLAALDVLEAPDGFAEPLDALLGLARERGATVVLHVPNDVLAEGGGSWSEGALDELRSLLPADHVVAEVVELRGAVVRPAGASGAEACSVDAPEVADPAAWLLAWGPHAAALGRVAVASAADTVEARRAERRLRSELEVLRAAGGS